MPREPLHKETLVITAGTLCQPVSACTHSTRGFSYCRAGAAGGRLYFLYTTHGEKKHVKSTVLRWESQALARQIQLELSGEQA